MLGNCAGLKTIRSSRLSHRELRSSFRESNSFLNLRADTTMASSQATQPTKMNKREATLAFIEVYRSLPELWDTENRNYSNRVKKAAAYDTLIEKLKVLEPDASRESVVKKINNLRSAFRKELKKVNDSKRSGTSADDLYVPSLWYYNELLFLVDQETPDKSSSTLGGLPVEEDEDQNNQCIVSVNQLSLFTNEPLVY
jgi:hypothetical protein